MTRISGFQMTNCTKANIVVLNSDWLLQLLITLPPHSHSQVSGSHQRWPLSGPAARSVRPGSDPCPRSAVVGRKCSGVCCCGVLGDWEGSLGAPGVREEGCPG